MSSFKFNNYFVFITVATLAFIIIYKLSIIIEKYSILPKKFLVWCGKNSLCIFLIHPFLLAIVPYILIANFNIKDVYSKTEYLILIYFIVFASVYLYEKVNAIINRKTAIKIINENN